MSDNTEIIPGEIESLSGGEAPSETSPPPDEPSPIERTLARAHDESVARQERGQGGRFARPAPSVAQAQAQDQIAPNPQAQPQHRPQAPTSPQANPPQSAPAAIKAQWNSVPPEVRAWVAQREQAAHHKITQLGEAARASQDWHGVTEQFQPVLAQHYRTDEGHQIPAPQVFAHLIAADQAIRENPVEALHYLARSYGVDLAGNHQDGSETVEVQSLKAMISRLEQQISETGHRIHSREQQEQAERAHALGRLVEDFAKDKSHWPVIEQDVAEQIAAIRARDPNMPPDQVLKQAYERALKLNETVATSIAAEERKKADTRRKKVAEEARRLATINVKSSNGASPSKPTRMEDTMRAVADRLMPNG